MDKELACMLDKLVSSIITNEGVTDFKFASWMGVRDLLMEVAKVVCGISDDHEEWDELYDRMGDLANDLLDMDLNLRSKE